MVNKQNLWFITLFSLIMVLSIYYLTMSDDALSAINVSKTNDNATEVVVSENETLVALKVSEEEALIARIDELEGILLNNNSTLEEKNKAYDELQDINKKEGAKENIEKTIKEKFKLDSYAKISGNNISITIASKNHDTKLANNIIRSVQELYNENMYITVKFS